MLIVNDDLACKCRDIVDFGKGASSRSDSSRRTNVADESSTVSAEGAGESVVGVNVLEAQVQHRVDGKMKKPTLIDVFDTKPSSKSTVTGPGSNLYSLVFLTWH